ncbi:MAG: hypothetical protein ACK56I_06575 [bacterium]
MCVSSRRSSGFGRGPGARIARDPLLDFRAPPLDAGAGAVNPVRPGGARAPGVLAVGPFKRDDGAGACCREGADHWGAIKPS